MKPIQIIVDKERTLFVLCDDGSIWYRTSVDNPWHRIDDIPKPETPK